MKINRELAREREDRAWELRQKGWTQAAIGRELGISQVGAGKALRRAERRVLRQLTDRIEGIKAVQHAQLEHVIMEAMSAWERSKLDTKTTKVTKDGDGGKVEKTLKTTPGNPQFLSEARGAMADIRKVWGIGVIDEDGYTPMPASDRKEPQPKDDSGLPHEIKRLRESFVTFGGDDGEFLKFCSEAESMGELGGHAHMIELRRLVGPTFRLALRGTR